MKIYMSLLVLLALVFSPIAFAEETAKSVPAEQDEAISTIETDTVMDTATEAIDEEAAYNEDAGAGEEDWNFEDGEEAEKTPEELAAAKAKAKAIPAPEVSETEVIPADAGKV